MDLVPTAAVIYRDVGGAVHNALFMSMGTKGLHPCGFGDTLS